MIRALQNKYPTADIFLFTQDESDDMEQFRAMSRVKLMVNTDVLETFEYLCNADVLVICKSSFSYLAGLYSKSSEIYVETTDRPNPSHWRDVEDLFQSSYIESFISSSETHSWNYFIYFMVAVFVLCSGVFWLPKFVRCLRKVLNHR